MMQRLNEVIVLFILAAMFAGCQRQPTQQTYVPPPLPESFSAGVASLNQYYDTIKKAFTSGTPDEAHDALHEIGRLLEHLPTLAKDAGLSEDDQKMVEDAIDGMFDSYGKLDGSLHGGADADYDSLSDTLKSSMESIQSALESQSEPGSESDDSGPPEE